jgi:GT2 family glycosyltransferase
VRAPGPIKVVSISLDEPLRPLAVEERYTAVLLVVTSRGSVVGEVKLPALTTIPADMLRRAIAARCGGTLWRRELEAEFLQAARDGGDGPRLEVGPSVSVVVCTRDRPAELQDCLDSLLALATPPHEILVVDNAPSDDTTQRLCADLPVRYVLEELPGQTRARNRGILETSGELVAFTDDDCIVDRHWLDRLGAEFADPLVSAVTGYVAPAELESPSQVLFELHGGFDRGFERRLFRGQAASPVRVAGRVGAGANMILRRSMLERVGLFREDLGPGTPARAADETELFYRVLAAGDRILFDPSRIVWHRHRRTMEALRKILYDYGVAVSSFCTRALVCEREPAALGVLGWWLGVHIREDLGRILRREPGRLPLRMVLAEIRGTLSGPWRLLQSHRSRRGIPPLELPEPPTVPAEAPAPPAVGPDAPLLSVVIPSHDRADLLVQVLTALAVQEYPADRFEAVVVLDACSDGSADRLRSLELPYALRIVEHDARNSAASRNRGVREAQHPIVVFLDDDVVPEPGVLAAHAAVHRANPDGVASLGDCPPVVPGRSPWDVLIRGWWQDHYRQRAEPGHRWTYADFASANASLPRSVLLEHPYDEAFPTRREDWELGIRLVAAGVRFVHCPGPAAAHYLDTTFPTALRHRRQDGCADAVFAAKHRAAGAVLPLASFLASNDETVLHEQIEVAGADPERFERRIRRRLPLLSLLAALHLRGAWRRCAYGLLREEYLLGLVDALGSAEQVAALAASVFDVTASATRVSLDEPRPRRGDGSLGSVELELVRAGAPVARIVAMNPGDQWDWEVVAERVVSRVGDDLREAVLLEELERPARLGRSSARRLEESIRGR